MGTNASYWSVFYKHQVADHWLISSPSHVSREIIGLSLNESWPPVHFMCSFSIAVSLMGNFVSIRYSAISQTLFFADILPLLTSIS